jgi:hypothetical protein
MNTNIARAIRLAPPTWLRDRFGSYLPAKDEETREVPPRFSPDSWCFNCGEFGHPAEECDKPTFADLFTRFSDLGGKGRRAFS